MTDETHEFFGDNTEAAAEAIEQNIEVHAAATESLLSAITGTDDVYDDAAEGYRRAYSTWMTAVSEMLKEQEVDDGEDVDVEEIREIWLEAANQAFKDMMTTSAFAAATGETIGATLDAKQEMDEVANRTARSMGFATAEDIDEVGERLVELERRHHAVERKIDELSQKV